MEISDCFHWDANCLVVWCAVRLAGDGTTVLLLVGLWLHWAGIARSLAGVLLLAACFACC